MAIFVPHSSAQQALRLDETIQRSAATLGVTNAAGQPLDDFGDAGYSKGRIDEMMA